MTDEVMTIVDFSEDISEAEQPEPLPEGVYPAEVLAAEVKVSQKGTKYGAVTFVISPDDFPADYPQENAPDGKVIVYRRLGLEDNQQARFMARRFCEALGAPMGRQLDLSQMVTLSANVHIKHGEWEGVTREEIDKVEAA